MIFAPPSIRTSRSSSRGARAGAVIGTDQDRKFVYILGAADTVERRNIKLGRVIDGLRMIPEGLKPGDRLIVTGIQKVFPGSKATAVPITASAETFSGERP